MIDDEILAHAKACAPAECCGLIVAGQYFPCRNIAADPNNHFEIDPVSWAAAEDKGEIEAIVHSHPDGTPFLSEADWIAQRRSGLPWWLVCDEEIRKFRNVPRLIGRTFEHGVMDCYTLMRDAYHLCGHDLPDFVRNDGWWRRRGFIHRQYGRQRLYATC